MKKGKNQETIKSKYYWQQGVGVLCHVTNTQNTNIQSKSKYQSDDVDDTSKEVMYKRPRTIKFKKKSAGKDLVSLKSPNPPSAANKAVVRRRPQQCYAVTLLRVTVLPQQQTIADYAQHLVFRADEIPKNGSKKRIQSQNKDGARPT